MNELDFSNELKMLGDLLVSQYRDVLAREGINATDRLSNTAGVEVTKGATFWDLSLRLEDYWKSWNMADERESVRPSMLSRNGSRPSP